MAAAWHFIHRTLPGQDALMVMEPGLTIHNVRYVKNVAGQTVWILEADSAQKDEATGSITGQGIRITFFKAGAPRYFLHADHGRAEIKAGLFKVWGNVVLETEDRTERLLTDELDYDENKELILTDRAVRFWTDEIRGSGKGLIYYLREGKLILRQEIKMEVES